MEFLWKAWWCFVPCSTYMSSIDFLSLALRFLRPTRGNYSTIYAKLSQAHIVVHTSSSPEKNSAVTGLLVLVIGHLTRKYTAPGIRDLHTLSQNLLSTFKFLPQT